MPARSAAVTATAPPAAAAGQGNGAVVRPEKVRFGEAGENVCSVEVRQIVYLGVSTQYITELADGTRLVLYQQNAHDSAGPEVGEQVAVTWDANHCLILGG